MNVNMIMSKTWTEIIIIIKERNSQWFFITKLITQGEKHNKASKKTHNSCQWKPDGHSSLLSTVSFMANTTKVQQTS